MRQGLLMALMAGVMVWGQAGTAGAAPTAAQKCEAAKLTALGKAQACMASAKAKEAKGGLADLAKCSDGLAAALAVADKKAATAGTSCRFTDNGDGTVTDLNNGLVWEQKVDGTGCTHCVGDTYDWVNAMSEFISNVNGYTDSSSTQTGLVGHSDWRLPTIVELQTILLPCSSSPCIDPIFGPTASYYWSSSTVAAVPALAWGVYFVGGFVFLDGKSDGTNVVRAVRGGL
jgi:hypothetical protein